MAQNMTLNFFGPHNNLADRSIACAVCLASARATMTPAKLTLIAPLPGQESTMVAPLLTPPPTPKQQAQPTHLAIELDG